MRIFKYQIVPEPGATAADVEMPHGARLLSVGAQGDDMVVWAIVDPQAKAVVRRFAVYPTGLTEVPAHPGRFLGTVMFEGGRLVFHVFEVGHVGESS